MSVPVDRYLAPPAACARLAEIAAGCGGSVLTQTHETRGEYPLPRHALPELRDFLRPQSAYAFAPAFLADLPGGRVFGSGNVLSPDGRLIAREVSPDFGKSFEDHWLLSYKKIRPPVPLRDRTAVIATTLGKGYGHWLLEELPRLFPLKPGECEQLIAHADSGCNRTALALHGFPGGAVELKRYSHFSCEHLLVPSLGQLTPATVAALQDFVVPLHQASSFGERIYISRSTARRRRVANEAELWATLAAQGFVKLHLEELTWPQQISAFRAAKIIVGPHGAGLANLAFCAPGTKVVEFFHRSYVNGCFWKLAALKKLDYRPVIRASGSSLAQLLSANRLDIEVDLAQLKDALRK